MTDKDLTFRAPTAWDGAALHALVSACPPLDENSTYCNLLQCSHFADTCVVVERDGELIAFVSGYRKPAEPQVYFLWQVGVSEKGRGRGLAKRMIRDILAREVCRGVTTLHTTATPSNETSKALFQSFARAEGAQLEESVLFSAEHFGDSGHEPEHLLAIAPLSTPPTA